jgi:serine/threonine-protein kinase haspin
VRFAHWSSELEPHFKITKIAEASFSEVYRLSALGLAGTANQESVLKVVALKTPPNAPLPYQTQTRAVRDRESQAVKEMADRNENDQWKSEIADVLSEVKLLQNLNHIPGFTNFRDMTILQGRPSSAFANAWKVWNKSRPRSKKSEFPDPSKKASYEDTQLWAVVEMQDAGTDCEKVMEYGGLNSIWEVWDVFWGVCLGVAKAEEACKFEHRDLHMGNICVRSSRAGGDVMEVTVKDPMRRKYRFTGLETTVIDYTLSRATILPSSFRRSSSSSINTTMSSSSSPQNTEQDVAWLDLNKDPALFEGDASEEYQYEVYRYMRGVALYQNPLQNAPFDDSSTPRRSPRKNTHIRFDESNSPPQSPHKPAHLDATEKTPGNVWKRFHPKTNIVWTHFLLYKLLTHLRDSANTPDQLSTKQIMSNIEVGEENIEPLKVKKKALKLYNVLKRISELLCPVALTRQQSLGSVKELVVLALEERWLRVEDVAA